MNKYKLYRYYLPNIDHEGWAEILVCSFGMISAVSDYGNYAFAWRHHGREDFRDFIIDLARDARSAADSAISLRCAIPARFHWNGIF